MKDFHVIDKISITTPKCRFLYPRLVTPETKFDPAGFYKVVALLDPVEAAEIGDQLDDLWTRHKAHLKEQAPTHSFKAAELPYGFTEFNEVAGFQLKCKAKASGVDQRTGESWTSRPALFDAAGRPITDLSKLNGMWTGTIGRVSIDACPFYRTAVGAGITLRLRAVQILEMVTGGGDAESFGFDAVEGWSADAAPSTPADLAPVPFEAGVAPDEADF
jgi:hypothetical protein